MFSSAVSKTLTRSKRIPVTASSFAVAGVLLACILPIAISGTIPGLQQDWYWPSDRAFVWDWLSDWIGQWSGKGLGQPNLLPMETFIVFIQAILVYVFGPAIGLAAYLYACSLVAAFGVAALLKRLGISGTVPPVVCGLYYALGPVFFVRVQAGHLAYLAAYAVLPWILATAADIADGKCSRWVRLAALCAIAYSQIQFIAYVPVAIVLWGIVYCRSGKAVAYIALGVAAGAALQLQGIAPLIVSSSRAYYLAERPLTDWLLNLSADPFYAIGGLGYFVPYYARAALPGASLVAVVLPIIAAAVGLLKFRRPWLLAALVFAFGWTVSTGLRGPFDGAAGHLLQIYTPLAVFRDFHYAAVFTALGSTIFIACALTALPLAGYVFLPVVLYVAAPSLGFGLLSTGLPRPFLERMKAEAMLMSLRGPGPVLWLPAEGPIGFAESSSRGRDPAMYTYDNVPFVGDSRDLRIVSQIDDLLHAGRVPVNLFRRSGIRYIVTRPELASSRSDRLGSSAEIGFAGRSIADIDSMLRRTSGVTLIAQFARDRIYEVRNPWPQLSVREGVTGPLLFSDLPIDAVALLPQSAKLLDLPTAADSPDPRRGWQSAYVGAWYNDWLNDSIYPYVFTESDQPLHLKAGRGSCVMIADRSAHWSLREMVGTVTLQPRGFTAVAGFTGACGSRLREGPLTVALSSFDGAWRMRTPSGWARPHLVDGWAMGWRGEPGRMIYVPAVVQALSVFFDLLLGVGFIFFRRRPARD